MRHGLSSAYRGKSRPDMWFHIALRALGQDEELTGGQDAWTVSCAAPRRASGGIKVVTGTHRRCGERVLNHSLDDSQTRCSLSDTPDALSAADLCGSSNASFDRRRRSSGETSANVTEAHGETRFNSQIR